MAEELLKFAQLTQQARLDEVADFIASSNQAEVKKQTIKRVKRLMV